MELTDRSLLQAAIDFALDPQKVQQRFKNM